MRKSFSLTFFLLSQVLSGFHTGPKENDFLMFGFTMENIKENQIYSEFLKFFHIF